MWITSPSHGATRVLLNGSIDIPSPTIFCAKTGSGTCSIGTSIPVIGATNETLVIGVDVDGAVVVGVDIWSALSSAALLSVIESRRSSGTQLTLARKLISRLL